MNPGRLHALIDGIFAIVFLLFVSIIPWPTAIASQYADQGSQATPAAVLYAGTMLMMGLSFAWSWRYLCRRTELVNEATSAAYPAGYRRALLGALAYLVALVTAFVSPAVSFAIDAAVAVYFAISRSDVPALLIHAAGRRVPADND